MNMIFLIYRSQPTTIDTGEPSITGWSWSGINHGYNEDTSTSEMTCMLHNIAPTTKV
ncbi:MAG: hypothetical protein P8166_02585 [Candidatus Thiodiazotropha sp.]